MNKNDIWTYETPYPMIEGGSIPFTITFDWATTVGASPTVEIYKDGSSTNTASTYMPSGSHSVSGNTITMKNFTNVVPGKYVLVINATVDGVADVWKHGVQVSKQEAPW